MAQFARGSSGPALPPFHRLPQRQLLKGPSSPVPHRQGPGLPRQARPPSVPHPAPALLSRLRPASTADAGDRQRIAKVLTFFSRAGNDRVGHGIPTTTVGQRERNPVPFAVDPGDGRCSWSARSLRLPSAGGWRGVADRQGRRVFVKLFYGTWSGSPGSARAAGDWNAWPPLNFRPLALVHAGPWSAGCSPRGDRLRPRRHASPKKLPRRSCFAAFAPVGNPPRRLRPSRCAPRYFCHPAGILLIDGDGIYAARTTPKSFGFCPFVRPDAPPVGLSSARRP